MSKRQIKLQQKPWITQSILKLTRVKNKLYAKSVKSRSPSNFKQYKVFSNNLIKIKEKSKQKYYNQRVRSSTKNSKLTWKLVNDIVKLKGKKTKQISHIVGTNNSIITEPKEISNTFNNFFVSVGRKLSNSF